MINDHNHFLFSGDSEEEKAHWIKCEKNHDPFILVSSKGEFFYELFFDITNLTSSEKISEISSELYEFYKSYAAFFLIDNSLWSDYDNPDYFFQFIVKKEHLESIAHQLYYYLKSKI